MPSWTLHWMFEIIFKSCPGFFSYLFGKRVAALFRDVVALVVLVVAVANLLRKKKKYLFGFYFLFFGNLHFDSPACTFRRTLWSTSWRTWSCTPSRRKCCTAKDEEEKIEQTVYKCTSQDSGLFPFKKLSQFKSSRSKSLDFVQFSSVHNLISLKFSSKISTP